MISGIAHVAGLYPTSTSFVTDGATAIKNLGPNSKTIKLFLSSDYATKYPNQTGWGTVTSLATLAASTPMATAIGDSQFEHIFLNIFPWWSGFEAESLTNYWINGVTTGLVSPATYLANEESEVQDLVEYLQTTYANTGKTFYLQNWEGDWQLLNSFVYTDVVNPWWANRMAAVMNARRRGVKAAGTAAGVTVKFGIECNRTLDRGGRRVIRDVAPLVRPDYISWSAYEGMTTGAVYAGGTIASANAYIADQMRRFHAQVQRYCPGVQTLIGEYGWPENEINTTTFPVGSLIQNVLDVGTELGWTHAVYWQIADNEETSPGVPRGFYIIKPDTTYSLAGQKFLSVFA